MKRLAAIALLLSLSACSNPQSFGIGPWPVYAEPAPLEFTPDEQAELKQFAHDHPALFKRIQGQANSYRAIVQEHNKRAKEMNKKQLKTLGFDDEAIRQTME
jgi:hypothetical protein